MDRERPPVFPLHHGRADHQSLGVPVREVRRDDADKWHDVDIEIDYHPAHAYNVNRMIDAVKKSLDYYTTNFGPYQYHQLRIVEFPRYATFAQSLPNTIPFSEAIGFIARVDKSRRRRLSVLRDGARGRAPVVGAPGRRRRRAGRHHALRDARAVLRADGHGEGVRPANMRKFLEYELEQLPHRTRRASAQGGAARARGEPAVHPLQQRRRSSCTRCATTSARIG